MMQFTVENLIRACQNDIKTYEVFEIDPCVRIAYDPEADTTLVYSSTTCDELTVWIWESEVQDFYLSEAGTLTIYI